MNTTWLPGVIEYGDMHTDNTTYTYSVTREVILAVNMYGLPVIICLGLLGNSLSFILFLSTRLKHKSSSVYLAFLNFADCLFLLCLLVAQLEWYRVYIMRTDGVCQLVVYFSYIGAFLSVWTVVAFTADRFIAVYFPLHRAQYCTRGRARKVVLSLLAASLLLYSFSLWTSGAQTFTYGTHKECMVLRRHAEIVYGLSVADTVLTMLLPSLLILLLNTALAFAVWRYLRQDRLRRASGGPAGEDTRSGTADVRLTRRSHRGERWWEELASARTSTRRWYQSHRVQMRTTRALLTISSLFVLLNAPSHAFRVWATLNPQGDMPSEWLLLMQLVFQFTYYLNFSSNFFIYCACHKGFRRELGSCAMKLTDCFRCHY